MLHRLSFYGWSSIVPSLPIAGRSIPLTSIRGYVDQLSMFMRIPQFYRHLSRISGSKLVLLPWRGNHNLFLSFFQPSRKLSANSISVIFVYDDYSNLLHLVLPSFTVAAEQFTGGPQNNCNDFETKKIIYEDGRWWHGYNVLMMAVISTEMLSTYKNGCRIPLSAIN